MKRHLVPGEQETGRRERCVRETNRAWKHEHITCFAVVMCLLFNEAFAYFAGGNGDIIKSSKTGKFENARNVFWETSFEYRLLPTAVSTLKSLEMDSDTFPTNCG